MQISWKFLKTCFFFLNTRPNISLKLIMIAHFNKYIEIVPIFSCIVLNKETNTKINFWKTVSEPVIQGCSKNCYLETLSKIFGGVGTRLNYGKKATLKVIWNGCISFFFFFDLIPFSNIAECNLEFKGSIQNIQKRAVLAMCYPKKYLKIAPFSEKKDTFLSNIRKDSVWLSDTDFFWIIPCIDHQHS